ncbi:MAG TPA: hypothetical protein VMW56_28795 [Candidatus Margulisiibacteriota bacterium]|nr:hypothetical protein [Candidatus Margulisiibacteriota bacterium]
MTVLTLALAASAIPSIPLVLAHFGVMTAITNAMLVLCVVALWLERERTSSHHPVPFDHDERLAA